MGWVVFVGVSVDVPGVVVVVVVGVGDLGPGVLLVGF